MMDKRNSDKLKKAIRSLEDAIKYSRSGEFQTLNLEFKSVLIASVVQNFSLTFRVCLQMIGYQLTDILGTDTTVKGLLPEDVLKLAAKNEIISNLNSWLEYLNCEHLSQSSHAALRTFEKATAFVNDAGELLYTCGHRQLNERRIHRAA